MKKFRKLLAVCCLVSLLLPLLCGCGALDEMRASQAFYDEEGNILWNGTVYKKLPQGECFTPEIDYSNRVNVTQRDVPVLLQEMFAEEVLKADSDDLILEKTYSYSPGYYDEVYYCRADRYEEVAKRLEAPFAPDMVCYEYYVYNPETEEYEDKIYRLSDEEWGVLKKILETVEPMQVSEGWDLDYDRIVFLEESSEDRLFSREFLDLMVCGSTYYLRFDYGRETKIYEVPKDAAPHVAKIMEAEMQDYLLTEPEEWDA